MIPEGAKLALFMEGALGEDLGKMGYGVLRYSENDVVCAIDSAHVGKSVGEVVVLPMRDSARQASRAATPVVSTIAQAISLGANALVLGIAPPGGLIPESWYPVLQEAAEGGLLIVNGLHDLLAPRFGKERVWDMRVEPKGLAPGRGLAKDLTCKRVLMIGTDMAVGKMTAGLEIWALARQRGFPAEFVATGQIGITVTGRGVPLDAVRVDFASGSIEVEVIAAASRLSSQAEGIVIIEGQGALIHPGSTANLPLLRGSCPTHLVLCHKARMDRLRRFPDIAVPPLSAYAGLYEDLGQACGAFPRPRTVAVALNTSGLSDEAALSAVQAVEDETGWPCSDPLRHGADRLLDAI